MSKYWKTIGSVSEMELFCSDSTAVSICKVLLTPAKFVEILYQISRSLDIAISCAIPTQLKNYLPVISAFSWVDIKPLLFFAYVYETPIFSPNSKGYEHVDVFSQSNINSLNLQYLSIYYHIEGTVIIERYADIFPTWIPNSCIAISTEYCATNHTTDRLTVNISIGITSELYLVVFYEMLHNSVVENANCSLENLSKEQLEEYFEPYYQHTNQPPCYQSIVGLLSQAITRSIERLDEIYRGMHITALVHGADMLSMEALLASGFELAKSLEPYAPKDTCIASNRCDCPSDENHAPLTDIDLWKLDNGQVDIVTIRSMPPNNSTWLSRSDEYPTNLVLLLGQSNMAGRGDLTDFHLRRDSPQYDEDNARISKMMCMSNYTSSNCKNSSNNSNMVGHFIDRDASISNDEGHSTIEDNASVQPVGYGEYVKLMELTVGNIQSDGVFGYDPELGWTKDVHMLHHHVDITKVVGYSAAPAFGEMFHQYLAQHASSSLDYSSDRNRKPVLGLIPMSVGATGINEWQAHSRCHHHASITPVSFPNGISYRLPICQLISSSRGIASWNLGPLLVARNARYQQQAVNLFSCALRTLYEAVVDIFLQCDSTTAKSYECSLTSDVGIDVNYKAEETRKTVVSIDGLLWYQGENDCSPENASISGLHKSQEMSYSDKLAQFFQQFGTAVDFLLHLIEKYPTTSHRCNQEFSHNSNTNDHDVSCNEPVNEVGNGFPHLSIVAVNVPVVVVGIATTRPHLVKPPGQLTSIRSQLSQFAQFVHPARNSGDTDSSIWGVICRSKIGYVDAVDLPLRPDCIHLTSIGYIELGIRLARKLASFLCVTMLQRPTISFNVPTAVSQLHPIEKLVEVYRNIRMTCQHHLDTENDATLMTACRFSPRMNIISINDSTSTIEGSAADNKKVVSVLKCGLKPTNFVYGEVCCLDLISLFYLAVYLPTRMDSCCNNINSTTTGEEEAMLMLPNVIDADACQPVTKPSRSFVSLGSGSGPCIAAAIISELFHNITGIELLHSKFVECAYVTSSVRQHFQSTANINLIENNFGKISWHEDVDVVYSCATCYGSDQLSELMRIMVNLKQGARVVLIDSQFLVDEQYVKQIAQLELASESACLPSISTGMTFFKLIGSKLCQASWGLCCGYVFEKIV